MKKKTILFLCTGNSCRSQMAEGLCRDVLGDTYQAFSAGTKAQGVNPRALKVMGEIGIDISGHTSKTVDELEGVDFDYVITVCQNAHENCPYFPGGQIIHHGFDDPPHLTEDFSDEEEILQVYRRVRDEIRKFILNFDPIK